MKKHHPKVNSPWPPKPAIAYGHHLRIAAMVYVCTGYASSPSQRTVITDRQGVIVFLRVKHNGAQAGAVMIDEWNSSGVMFKSGQVWSLRTSEDGDVSLTHLCDQEPDELYDWQKKEGEKYTVLVLGSEQELYAREVLYHFLACDEPYTINEARRVESAIPCDEDMHFSFDVEFEDGVCTCERPEEAHEFAEFCSHDIEPILAYLTEHGDPFVKETK